MTNNHLVEACSRIYARTAIVGACLEWRGYLDHDGYGAIGVDYKHYKVHRLTYEQRHGPIPSGLTIDHLCCNKACVNPDHLEPVTNRENHRRREHGKTACRQGHTWTVETTKWGRGKFGHLVRACRICLKEARRRSYDRFVAKHGVTKGAIQQRKRRAG